MAGRSPEDVEQVANVSVISGLAPPLHTHTDEPSPMVNDVSASQFAAMAQTTTSRGW